MRVDVTINDHIAELVLNAPPVNALNSDEWHELADTLEQLSDNKDVHVLLIRALGKGFCAGVDIKELQKDPTKSLQLMKDVGELQKQFIAALYQ